MSEFIYNPETAMIGLGTKSLRIIEILAPYIQQGNTQKYDFIDCAWRYGNEAIIGLSLKQIKKNDMQFNLNIAFQSKVWPSQYTGGIAKSLKFSLSKIGAIESMGCYLLHRPSPALEVNLSAWKQLLDCRRNRLTKKIGLCNFDISLINYLFNATNSYPDYLSLPLSVDNMETDKIEFCKENNIELQSSNPLGDYEENEKNPIIIELAEKYNTNAKNLLLAFLLNSNITPVIVPSTEAEIITLIQSKKIVLEKIDLEKLNTLNKYSVVEN